MNKKPDDYYFFQDIFFSVAAVGHHLEISVQNLRNEARDGVLRLNRKDFPQTEYCDKLF